MTPRHKEGGPVKGNSGKWAALLAVVLAVALAASAWAAFQALPSDGTQVNSDAAAGINPSDPVVIEDPDNADVVGGALSSTAPAVPWAIFRQAETAAGKPDQIFVRAFKGGAWSTEGSGTVGGASSAAPVFSGSLNFDQSQNGEAPTIDFAGANRAVPWATWYETAAVASGHDQIFASRFDNTQGKWIFAGQVRNVTGTPLPSLNIHTTSDAFNPAVAGGSTVDPTKPGPWIAWQETGGFTPGFGIDQIFVVKPVGPGTTACPAGTLPTGTGTVLGGFCWQQVGVGRLGGTDPSLNIDRTRAGVEPDIAFTGSGDSVPWVVWYENENTQTTSPKLHDNEMVFAAKAVVPNVTAPPVGTVYGGLNWVAVGRTGSGVLDGSDTPNVGGPCAASATAEAGCSLNADPNNSAEDPRVAAGTMTPGGTTVPWVVWDEGVPSGNPNDNSVFVARLVSGQFTLANGGQPIGTGDRADITFSGNTPYVSWHHSNQVQFGHFATPDQFVNDNLPLGTSASDEVRAPISSTCIANPFNGDGSACQAGALGTPFFLFTDGGASNAKLLGNAYQPDTPLATKATGVGATQATLNAFVNPEGGPARVHFDYGPTMAYGSSTPDQTIAPGDASTLFSAPVTGLASGSLFHYRAVASTDFVTVAGSDQVQRLLDVIAPTVTFKSVALTFNHHKHHMKLKDTVKVGTSEEGSARLVGTIVKPAVKKSHATVFSSNVFFPAAGTKTVTLTAGKGALNTLSGLFKKPYSTVKLRINCRVTDSAGNATTKTITLTLH
jgi:hypothetical protein